MSGAALSLLLSLASLPPGQAVEPRPVDGDMVVLLHGLHRTPRSLRKLERTLAARGYEVANLGYAARRRSIEELASHLGESLLRVRSHPGQRVHFVTHSLGGIIVRAYLRTAPPVNVGRVVMLAPPNGGSELVDLLKKAPWLRAHAGPCRGELGTGPEALAARLGPVDFELGVIAGDLSLNPLFSSLIPGPDDGLVSVERARVEGMKDFLVVPHTHTLIMNGRDVIRQTLAFLERGGFEREADEERTR